MLYYMQELKVSAEMSILTERNLEKYIQGTEASDVWAFAYLHTIGLQWSQLRIILDAFPTLTCVNTEANWELRQKERNSKGNGRVFANFSSQEAPNWSQGCISNGQGELSAFYLRLARRHLYFSIL